MATKIPVFQASSAFDWAIAPTISAHCIIGWKKISAYLDKTYNIQIDDDFGEVLLQVRKLVKNDGKVSFYPHAINSIYNVSRIWQKYLVNPEQFEHLMRYGLFSITQTHSAIFSNYFLKKEGFEFVDIGLPENSYAILINRYGDVKEIR